MTYIHATGTTIIQYPFTRSDLTAAHPNVSFEVNPTAQDLAPFNVFPVAPSPRPADTRELRAEESDPVPTDDGWQQAWAMRDATTEEVAQWDASNRPAPDWGAFKEALITSDVLDAALQAQGSVPASLLAVPAALEAAQNGDSGYLTACLSRVLELGLMPPEVGEVFVQAAEAAHLPAEVVELLISGEPSAN